MVAVLGNFGPQRTAVVERSELLPCLSPATSTLRWRLTLSLGGNRTLKNECSRALARAQGLCRRPLDPQQHRLYRRSQHRPWNHQKQPSPSSPVAPDAVLGTARGYGQSTPRELQLSYPATLSSAMLRATRTGPRARAPATPAIPLARTGSRCGCAAPPSSLRTGRVGE